MDCTGNEKTVRQIEILSKRVKSGDPENMEAQAARVYWRALMGESFRRDKTSGGINSALNYGYTVLRAATARAVCGAGLNPSLGLHHRSDVNAFALADDLMEPFRPLVDSLVWKLQFDKKMSPPGENLNNSESGLTPENKREIASVLLIDMLTERGMSPVANCLVRTAQSLANSLKEKSRNIELGQIVPGSQLL